ncbi:MAG: adenosylcobinamide-GDP ribazoletransferase [Fibrobacter sp.]|nr:adenosylcobinamide-GDP ribazoletransferase [Fibrobacter sp.]
MISRCVTSLRILTTIPVPGKDTPHVALSMPFFPLAGFLIALVMYSVYLLVDYCQPLVPLSGILLTGVLFLVTGGLHFDGFADCCDGFGSGKAKEKILLIFKDSRLGTHGVAGLCIDILLRITLYKWYVEQHCFMVILVSLVMSRAFQALALSRMKSATPGQGIASHFCQSGSGWQVVLSNVLVFSLCIAIASNRLVIAGSIVAAFIAGTIFMMYCRKRIGGVTGDCIGALSEISEVVILTGGVIGLSYPAI